jgi:hypothetical protein
MKINSKPGKKSRLKTGVFGKNTSLKMRVFGKKSRLKF